MRGAYLNPTAANPTADRAQVDLAVPDGAEKAQLETFGLLGRKVQTVATGLGSGRQPQTVEVAGLAPGVHVLRLRVVGTVATQKVTGVR